MTSVTSVEAFLENVFELRLKCEDVTDARRRRRHPTPVLFLELEKIEIISAIFLFLGAGECFFGNAEQRESWRQRECLLRAGQHHVDSKRVHVDLHSGERRDGI